MLSLVIAVFLLGVGCLSAHAATYYVSKSGSNSNSCSSAQSKSGAKGTINGGISCMSGGDTLIVGAGTYDEIITDLAGTGGYAVRPPSGSSWDAPTILKAETPGSVTVLVSSPPGGWPSVVEFDSNSSYIVLEGFVLDGQFARDPIIGIDEAAHHIRFKDLELKNSGGSGIQGKAHAMEFVNLHIHHSGWTATGNVQCTPSSCPTTCGAQANFCYQDAPIYAWSKCHGFCHAFYVGGSDHLVEGGNFHDNDYHALQWYASSSTIRNNTMAYNPGAGVGAFGGGNTIYNNVISHGGTGIQVTSGGGQVVGNTIYQMSAFGITTRDPSGILIKNNLVVGVTVNSEKPYIHAEGGTGATGNYFADNGYSTANIAGNLCDNTTMVGCAGVSASSTFFVNPGAGDFHNAPGAPQLNAGVSLPAPYTVDKDGGVRLQGAGWDAGAYEGTGSGVVPPPKPGLPAPRNLQVVVQ
jgi:hypothetical protein